MARHPRHLDYTRDTTFDQWLTAGSPFAFMMLTYVGMHWLIPWWLAL